jgi:hypothetical protein
MAFNKSLSPAAGVYRFTDGRSPREAEPLAHRVGVKPEAGSHPGVPFATILALRI